MQLIANNFGYIKANIVPLIKFFLVSWPVDVISCSFVYGPIKYASTSIALILHNISPFHRDLEQELNDDQDNDQVTTFIPFLKEHMEELPQGIAVSYVDEKLLGSFFNRVANIIAAYTYLDPIKEFMEPSFLKKSFPAKATNIYEYGYNGLHLLESLKPSWDILIHNKHPGTIITLADDLKEDLNIVVEYYKFIFAIPMNIIQLLHGNVMENQGSVSEESELFSDNLIPRYNDTGLMCELIGYYDGP